MRRSLKPWIAKAAFSALWWIGAAYLIGAALIGDRVENGRIVAGAPAWAGWLLPLGAVVGWAILSALWDRWQDRRSA